MCAEFVSILCPSQPSSSPSKLPIQFFREMHAARPTFDTRTTITKLIILEYSSSANNNVRVIITFVKHAVRLSNSRYSVSSTASIDIFFFSSVRERHARPPIAALRSPKKSQVEYARRKIKRRRASVLGGDGIALTFTWETRSIRTWRRMFRVRDENRSPIIIYDATADGVCVSRTKKHVHLLKPGNPSTIIYIRIAVTGKMTEKNSWSERGNRIFRALNSHSAFYSARIVIEPSLCFKIAKGIEKRWTKRCRNKSIRSNGSKMLFTACALNANVRISFCSPTKPSFVEFRSRTKVLARTVLR